MLLSAARRFQMLPFHGRRRILIHLAWFASCDQLLHHLCTVLSCSVAQLPCTFIARLHLLVHCLRLPSILRQCCARPRQRVGTSRSSEKPAGYVKYVKGRFNSRLRGPYSQFRRWTVLICPINYKLTHTNATYIYNYLTSALNQSSYLTYKSFAHCWLAH